MPPEAREDVVRVRRDHESLRGQPHALRVVAREDVPEIASGDDVLERHGGELGGCEGFGELMREVEVGFEVVDCLGEDAGPVDGVDSAETMSSVEFCVCEERFYDVL